MSRYTLHLRAKNGVLFDEGVERVRTLNIRAQQHIEQGTIVLGYTSPHTYLPHTDSTFMVGTRHFGKERDPQTGRYKE
jgi:hypothetical protein